MNFFESPKLNLYLATRTDDTSYWSGPAEHFIGGVTMGPGDVLTVADDETEECITIDFGPTWRKWVNGVEVPCLDEPDLVWVKVSPE